MPMLPLSVQEQFLQERDRLNKKKQAQTPQWESGTLPASAFQGLQPKPTTSYLNEADVARAPANPMSATNSIDELKRLQEMAKPKPAPAGPPIAQAVGAAAMGSMPSAAAEVGPKPIVDQDAIRKQTMMRNLRMYENSKQIVDARRAGTLDEGVRQNLVNQNAGLRGENRLAAGALAPAPQVRTPEANADWLKRSDYILGEQAGQKLKELAPDDPMRAGYQAAYDNFRSKYLGVTPTQVAGSISQYGIAGPALAFTEGAPRADAAYAQAGQAATGRQTAAVDTAESRRKAFEDEYFKLYGNRTAAESEQKRQQQNEIQQRIAMDNQVMAERDAMTKRAQAEAAYNAQLANPEFANREQELRRAQFDAELAKAQGAAKIAGATSNAQANEAMRTAAMANAGIGNTEAYDMFRSKWSNAATKLGMGGQDSIDAENEIVTGILPVLEKMAASPGGQSTADSVVQQLLSELPSENRSVMGQVWDSIKSGMSYPFGQDQLEKSFGQTTSKDRMANIRQKLKALQSPRPG